MHYTRLQQDQNNKNILIMYDRRRLPSPSGGTGSGYISATALNDPKRGKAAYGVALDPGEVAKPAPPPPVTTGDLAIQLGPSRDDILWMFLPKASTAFLEIKDVSVRTQKEASESIGFLEDAVELLSEERGRMGAYENRLEHSMRSTEVTYENMTAAESHIRDADMALLVTDLAKEGVLDQAAQAMLAQANGTAQNILSLLNQ